MSVLQGYPTTLNTPQNALQALLQPSRAQQARLDALDQVRVQRMARAAQAAELRHEARMRLARQRLIDGVVELAAYRDEVAAADKAMWDEQSDVPLAINRADLQDEAHAIAAAAKDAFYDKRIAALEKQAAAWTPAAVHQAAGGDVGDE